MVKTLVEVKKALSAGFLKDRSNGHPRPLIRHAEYHGPDPGWGNLAVGVGKEEQLPLGGLKPLAKGKLFVIRPGIFFQDDDQDIPVYLLKTLKHIKAFIGGSIIDKDIFGPGIILNAQASQQPFHPETFVPDGDNHRNQGRFFSGAPQILPPADRPPIPPPFQEKPQHKEAMEPHKDKGKGKTE
jgi:hypothetical protein